MIFSINSFSYVINNNKVLHAIVGNSNGDFPGSASPIGKATAGTTVLNIFAGMLESRIADFFTYKDVMYT